MNDAGPPASNGPTLLGFDGSAEAGNAIARAGELLEGRRALVAYVWTGLAEVLLHSDAGAMPAPIAEAAEEIDAADRERAEAVAAEGAQLALEAGFQAQPIVRHQRGNAWQTLRQCALEHHASAVVVGARGRSRVASVLLGSVSGGLAHHPPAPVLVVPAATSESSTGPVLFANDGSDNANRAVEAGSSLLSTRPAVVLHAWHSFAARMPPYLPGAKVATLGVAKEIDGIVDQEAHAIAHEAAGFATERGLETEECCLRTERPVWRAILDVADDRDAAAIVVGSRGLTGISAALGSVSQAVIHHARRPVLLVPPRQ